MKKSLEELIYFSVQQHNILPLTSACNMNCIFCSHQFNPPELEVYSLPSRTLAEVEDLIEFLDSEKKIVIGESVTRIMEGEPLLYPNFFAALAMIREKYPATPLQITTNGSLLTEETVKKLRDFLPLEINLSLNSASLEGRRILMKDKRAEISLQAPVLLKEYGLPFHGSIVAMPMVAGWLDLEETILYLAGQEAQTIRVFLPGYAKYNLPEWQFSQSLAQQLAAFIDTMRRKVKVPLLLEPTILTDLKANLIGVINNSSAQKAGLEEGDKILKVNGKKVASRVEAFNLIKKAENPSLFLTRNGNNFSRQLEKAAGDPGGIVLAYDLDLEVLEQWQEKIRRYQAERVLFLTSPLAEKIIQAALALAPDKAWQGRVVKVENHYLGGSLHCAGLLLVEDLQAALADFLVKESFSPQLILLSSLSFDPWGRDLLGKSYLELKEKFALPVELIFS